jgi:hypothetical protein
MDLDLYQQLFRRYWMLFLGIVLLTVGIVWAVSTSRSPAYEGSVFLSINEKPEQQLSQSTYQYGEFYGLQGSEFLAKYFAADLTDPGTVNEIFRKAQLSFPTNQSIKNLRRVFTLKPVGVAGLSVEFQSGSKDDTTRGLTAVQETAQNHLAALQQKGLYANIVMVPGQVFVRQTSVDLPLLLGIGAMVGLFLGFFVLLVLSLSIPKKHV